MIDYELNKISEEEFLDILNKFSDIFYEFNEIHEVINYSFNILGTIKIFTSYSIYMINSDGISFDFLKGFPAEYNFDQMLSKLIDQEIIGKMLNDIQLINYSDQENKTNYFVFPIVGYESILGFVVLTTELFQKGYNTLTKRIRHFATMLGLTIYSIQTKISKKHFQEMQNQIVTLKTIDLERKQHKLKIKMDQLTTNLNRSIPHEIRTPFLHILGLSDILLKYEEIDTLKNGDEIKSMLSDLNLAAKQLNKILDNYIYYANLVTISFNTNELEKIQKTFTEDIDSILYDTITEKAFNYDRYDDIEMNIIEGKVIGTPSLITKVLSEAFDNSFKFSEKNTKIILNTYLKEDFYIVSITDHGIGMTNEEMQSIAPYVQFNREFHEQQGLGLGLSIIIKILAILNGDFEIYSIKEKFTEIKIKFKIIA